LTNLWSGYYNDAREVRLTEGRMMVRKMVSVSVAVAALFGAAVYLKRTFRDSSHT
jgi:hypothetical protein